jgi:Mn-dependent DtxR family transcriptional regulator
MSLPIYESAEDYLEAILRIQEKKGVAHSVDIAELKHYSKASVSVAMKKLRENGYISMDKNGELHLLPPGLEIAERIYERHQFLTRLLVSIGVDEETAEEDACKLEHDLSEVSFAKLKEAFKDI